MTAARQPPGADQSALEIRHALVTELLANGLSPRPGRTLNTKALAERIAELLGAFAARKVAEAVAERDELIAALRGVLKEADRRTDAFDRAHAALARAEAP